MNLIIIVHVFSLNCRLLMQMLIFFSCLKRIGYFFICTKQFGIVLLENRHYSEVHK